MQAGGDQPAADGPVSQMLAGLGGGAGERALKKEKTEGREGGRDLDMTDSNTTVAFSVECASEPNHRTSFFFTPQQQTAALMGALH